MQLKGSKGFTLIEVMIVIAIIAGTITLAMPYINNRNAQTKAFVREMTVLSRELHTRAKLNGAAYRLVIELPEPGRSPEDTPPGKYWVEKSNSKVVLTEREE